MGTAMDMVLVMVMDMAMVIMDIVARGPLRLSLDMDIMVMDMVMDMDMDMAMATMDTMAKDPLTLSLVMDIMAMDMDTMDMVMAMDTTVKLISCLLVEFSTNEVGPIRSSQKTH